MPVFVKKCGVYMKKVCSRISKVKCGLLLGKQKGSIQDKFILDPEKTKNRYLRVDNYCIDPRNNDFVRIMSKEGSGFEFSRIDPAIT